MAFKGWTDQLAIDAWLEYLDVAKNRSDRTREAYLLAMRRLQEFMEPASILGASPAELEAFCGMWLNQRDVLALSRKPYVSAVRGFYRWAQAKGVIELNPSLQVEYPKTGKRLPNTITLANAERLLCAPNLATFRGMRDAAILHVLVGCGLRISGLVNLNEGDLQQQQIDGEVRMALITLEKGDKERLVPVPREAAAILRVYLAHEDLAKIDRDVKGRDGRPDRVLFIGTRNSTVTADRFRGEERRMTRQTVHRMLQRYGQPLGIPDAQLHPHAMRHLYGTRLTEGGASSLVVQELMGHDNIRSTAIYTALAVEMKTRVVDANSPLSRMNTPISELLKRLPR
ncbi:tyrosine-type recombinase/integrase [Variovorax sp. HJSM1_2]|uniref:tyrosine-type recombinase/integrase n=1 Tax=Variovorax sp. HJSM1_2 TaxID=3366263 RepID=UPI003BC36B85